MAASGSGASSSKSPYAKPIEFLDNLLQESPELSDEVGQLMLLWRGKLWHQLTLTVEACYNTAGFNRGDIPIRLFHSFVLDFAHKMNPLKLAQFAVHVSKFHASNAESVAFLEDVIHKIQEMKQPRSAEPILFLRMHVAQHQIEAGDTAAAKPLVEAGREQLDSMSGVDPSVSASVHYVASMYYKAVGDYAAYYRSSLMYLSYVSTESLAPDFKVRLAIDIALSALLGEGVYSFGALLQHPIVAALQGGSESWLYQLLVAFNGGDMHKYDELCVTYAEQLNAQPALVEHERRLREKVTLMCLLELIHGLPAEERTIRLGTIGEATKLSVDGVEFLLMKALALHLIEGVIDQVEGVVSISSVVPRILTRPQIAGLKGRLDTWISKVTALTSQLESETLGVVEPV